VEVKCYFVAELKVVVGEQCVASWPELMVGLGWGKKI
jgi:hypothetical protein